MPLRFRTNKTGDRLENIIVNSDTNSLEDGDAFYSFIANFDLGEERSWKALKSWVNVANGLTWEFLDRGWLADVDEVIGEKRVTIEELREAVEEDGMAVIEDRDL
jgi:hypothetical protein